MTTAEPVTHLSNESVAAPTDPNGPTGRLATWLAGTKIEDVPSTVREHAKYLLLDGIACALVRSPVARLSQRRGGRHGARQRRPAADAPTRDGSHLPLRIRH